MAAPKRPLRERIIEADQRSAHWLAEGNLAAERGDLEAAERYYEKSQFWLDRLNTLEGNN